MGFTNRDNISSDQQAMHYTAAAHRGVENIKGQKYVSFQDRPGESTPFSAVLRSQGVPKVFDYLSLDVRY